MKNIGILLLFCMLMFFSCKGQQKNGTKEDPDQIDKKQGNLAAFSQQKDRFEFKGYKTYYNGQLIKVDSIKPVYKIFGKPSSDQPEIIYFNKPLWITASLWHETDNTGDYIYIYKGKKTKYSYLKKNKISTFDYEISYEREKDGTLKGIVYQYSILMRPFKPRFTPKSRDSLLMQIPPLEGYVMVNGYAVNKNTTIEDLKQNLPRAGGWFGERVGIPTLVYDATTGHDFPEFDPKLKAKSVHINFLYMPDEETGIELLQRVRYSIELGM